MTQEIKDKLSKLFLDIEREVGTSELNDHVMLSLRKAIHDFREKDEQDFFYQFQELIETVKDTKPKIALIIDHFFYIWKHLCEAQKKPHPEGHLYWERKILDQIKCFRVQTKKYNHTIRDLGVKQIQNGDVVLIHSHSRTIMSVLKRAVRKRRKFHVILAEQELEKTQVLIEQLSKAGVSFQVVPEYMLSHVLELVTKVFLGGVTINSRGIVVADAGTSPIVSDFHLHKTPIYLFISTKKFSLWKTAKTDHASKIKTRKLHGYRDIYFERVKFTHDRIDLDLFDHVVTEKGILTPTEAKELYKKRYDERSNWRKEFGLD
jgi:translation initiation factor 2B subunit (eIF-2B alpha/beta/delta family)